MSAIVIGAGVDELVAAHILARAGRQVVVLDEQGDGGAGETEGWIPPQVVRALSLDRHGLRLQRPDMDGSVAAIGRLSAKDAQRWPEFCARMATAARLLERLYSAPPPDPLTNSLAEFVRLAGLAFAAHRGGRQGIEDLLRLLPMPVADLLDDWFEGDELKGMLGAIAVRLARRGPRAGGTALALLHQHVGSPPGVFLPPLSNVTAVLCALPGVEIRRAKAAGIRVNAGRVTAVVLEGGDELAAGIVASGAEPKRTLLGLLEPGWLDPEFVRSVRLIRSCGVQGLAVARSLDDLERASDRAKYDRAPQPSAHEHAELALDQFLWMRPLPELARYRTPVAGLYLCGPSMHPGPGILGASGLYCAREVLTLD